MSRWWDELQPVVVGFVVRLKAAWLVSRKKLCDNSITSAKIMVRVPPTLDVTALLAECSLGDKLALDALLPVVYEELRQIAERSLRHERADHTLQPTALVNEAYMRLAGQHHVSWQNRAQFFGVSAQIMRRILIDHARGKQAGKRGGEVQIVRITTGVDIPQQANLDVVALDDALRNLEALDARQAKVVEMRFFGGLSVEETAEALGVSPMTVKREWRMARAWLLRELERP